MLNSERASCNIQNDTCRRINLSVVIPTYRRGQVLLDTIRYLLELPVQPLEILIVDQTKDHPPKIAEIFQTLENKMQAGSSGFQGSENVPQASCLLFQTLENCSISFRRIVLSEPSIPHAMNIGLQEADGEIVLFLDDDIIPDENLISEHWKTYQNYPEARAVVGQVLQPEDGWRNAENLKTEKLKNGKSESKRLAFQYFRSSKFCSSPLRRDLDFKFNSSSPTWVENVMAGNLSVRKETALRIGGFDENFIPPVSFRFETEFAKRLVAAGGKIRFEPAASIRHLRAGQGGTRSRGSHLTSASPIHGVGDYYYALLHGRGLSQFVYMVIRPFRQVRTKFHLTHPWYIPVKLIGEIRAIGLALRLNRSRSERGGRGGVESLKKEMKRKENLKS